MKVILYMAISINGLIARENDDTSWISKEEWNSYSQMVRSVGNVIVGHRTYNILTRQPEFSELNKVKLVVVSHEDFEVLSSNHFVVHSPRKALELLKDFENVVVAGGGMLNASFMTENLIDEIYLDVQPISLGTGIPLFSNKEFNKNLKFLGQKNISDNEIQLHYKVLK